MRVALGLILSAAIAAAQFGGGGGSQHWKPTGPPGPLASRPATCKVGQVYLCVGTGCSLDGEYHYCTAVDTWTPHGSAYDGITIGGIAIQPINVQGYSDVYSTGNRNAVITLSTNLNIFFEPNSKLIDGVTGANGPTSPNGQDSNFAGKWWQFEFQVPKRVNGFRLYFGCVGQGGTWAWQASQDAISWTTLSTGFTLGNSPAMPAVADSLIAYKYYRLLGVTATHWENFAWNEMEFSIVGAREGLRTVGAISAETLILSTSTPRPTCNDQTRARLWYESKAAGAADVLSVCGRNAAGTYAWVAIATVP